MLVDHLGIKSGIHTYYASDSLIDEIEYKSLRESQRDLVQFYETKQKDDEKPLDEERGSKRAASNSRNVVEKRAKK